MEDDSADFLNNSPHDDNYRDIIIAQGCGRVVCKACCYEDVYKCVSSLVASGFCFSFGRYQQCGDMPRLLTYKDFSLDSQDAFLYDFHGGQFSFASKVIK